MSGSTTLLKYIKPTVSGDADVWGGYLNTNFDSIDKLQNVVTTTGSANAYVLTSGQTLTAYATGQRFRCKLNFTCSGSSTLNVDSIGAKTIKKRDATTNVSSGDLVSGQVYAFTYDGTNFVLETYVTSDVQPLDATLTALAALSWSSGAPVLQFTAADTVSLTLTPTVTTLTATGVVQSGAGASGAPGLAVGASNYGLYKTGSTIAFQTAGADRAYLAAAGLLATVPFGGNAGSAAAPSVCLNSGEMTSGLYWIGAGNVALALSGVKVVDWSSALAAYSMPVQARTPLSSETSGTLTSASANKEILATGGITLPNSVFSAQDKITIHGNGTARTITRGASVTMYINGVDSATGTLTANGIMAVHWRTASVCVLTGNVS